MSAITYLLWSNRHNAWWRPNSAGYTDVEADAGRYSEAEAVHKVVASAQCGIRTQVTCMVAAPDNWGQPAPTAAQANVVITDDPDPDALCCDHPVSSHYPTGCAAERGDCPCLMSEQEVRRAVWG